MYVYMHLNSLMISSYMHACINPLCMIYLHVHKIAEKLIKMHFTFISAHYKMCTSMGLIVRARLHEYI